MVLLDTETYEVDLHNVEIGDVRVEFPSEVLNVFRLIHPKPEIVVVGLGGRSRLLAEANRRVFLELGISLEVSHTANAVDVFDLLSTERPHVIGALMLPPNV